MRLGRTLTVGTFLLVAALQVASWAEPLYVHRFEKGAEGWEQLDGSRAEAVALPETAGRAGQALRIPLQVPESGTSLRSADAKARPYGRDGNGVVFKGRMTWTYARELRFDIYIPRVEKRVEVLVFVRDLDGLWFQTIRTFEPEPGAWTTVRIDASADSNDWEPRGHHLPWCGYAIQDLREFGIKILGAEGVAGYAYADNIVVDKEPVSLRVVDLAVARDVKAAEVTGPGRFLVPVGFPGLLPGLPGLDWARGWLLVERETPPMRLLNFTTSGEDVSRCGLYEITFELNRVYENPFDPDEVSIDGVFITPGGMVTVVPAFFHQDYTRLLEENVEQLVPAGRPVWKIRYAPQEEGRHRYLIRVKDRTPGEKKEFFRAVGSEGAERSFLCVPSDAPGYVRVARSDWHYFEFDNGALFYPIGHNIPATYNVKNAKALGLNVQYFEGTFAYDRFLDGMSRGEENFARIWLASWSFGLEWSRAYHPDYRDLGRYNLRNAWRLDYVLDQCGRRGIYAQVALTTFGHFRLEQFEGDWPWSPYNRKNGGPIATPQEFWSSPVCQAYYQRMLRYVMARWGHSPNVMSWEISNEIDLVSDYRNHKSEIIRWHQDCVKTIRRFDQGRHLVTTNFAVWSNDPLILELPEISYSSTNYYSRAVVTALHEAYKLKSKHRKPAMMAECGDDFKGSSAQTTETYIPICLWASYMMPFGGCGTQWWWDFIDDRNLYHYFKAVSRFAVGEDRRNIGLEIQKGRVVTLPEGQPEPLLGVECLGNDRKSYFWVYETMLLKPDQDWTSQARTNCAVEFAHLGAGEYDVEFWHTIDGVILKTVRAKVEEGKLRIPLPEFHNHIAAKVRPAEKSADSQ